jgi:hypothetical protein
MISTDFTSTGAAGAAPMPVFVVRPSRRDGVVAIAPSAAPQQGTGLPAAGSTGLAEARFARVAFTGTAFAGVVVGGNPAVRPWAPVTGATTVLERTTDVIGHAARTGGYAQRTDSSTPGAQPPRDPVS